MIYRVPNEIKVKLERMDPPEAQFNYKAGLQMQMNSSQLQELQKLAFNAGYNQAVKEMKRFFQIK